MRFHKLPGQGRNGNKRGRAWEFGWWSDGIYPSGTTPSAPEEMLKAAHTPCSSSLRVLRQHKPVPSTLAAPEEAWPGGGKGVSQVVFPLKVPVSPPALVHRCRQPSPSPCSFAEGPKWIVGAEGAWETEEG